MAIQEDFDALALPSRSSVPSKFISLTEEQLVELLVYLQQKVKANGERTNWTYFLGETAARRL